jgi:hypothetical protein
MSSQWQSSIPVTPRIEEGPLPPLVAQESFYSMERLGLASRNGIGTPWPLGEDRLPLNNLGH